MNWVGGARSRVKQSKERKIQKEFFERQRLTKKVNIHKQSLSPKGHRKPISLDLLSLQTINQTHQGENGVRKQPIKVVLGEGSNLLPRRQEDLELPMSPIRNPSSLIFHDGKMEMDTLHPRLISHQHNKPAAGDYESQQATGFKLLLPISQNSGLVSSKQADYSDTIIPLATSRDANDSQLSVPLTNNHNSRNWQLSSLKQQKHNSPQLPQLENLKHNQCLPLPKKDLLAFQRAEKEKCMSLKPLTKQLLHQPKAYITGTNQPTNNTTSSANQAAVKFSNELSSHTSMSITNNSPMIDEENPTVISMPSKLVAAHYGMGTSEKKNVMKSCASNDDELSDAEKDMLLGLDYEGGHDGTVGHVAVPGSKKAKTSLFEKMINNFEKPTTSSKPVASGNHDAWRKFTHEKFSTDETCRVPDISVEIPVDRKTNLFFKQKLPKKPKNIALIKRPSTVLQELLCLDEDLNNSDLFQTQDFTFEDALAADFEEPLIIRQFQHSKVESKEVDQTTNTENSLLTHYITSVEEVRVRDQQDHKELLPVQSLEGNTSGSISIGVQCDSNSSSLHDIETQTEQSSLLKHSSTQSDMVQLVDVAVQVTANDDDDRSVMGRTSKIIHDECLSDHQQLIDSSPDDLAVAQSTIVWQSLMIKILEINANTYK